MKPVDHGLTVDRLREVLSYDPETGIFRRKTRMGELPVGTLNSQGYVIISIDNKRRKSHRLAWLYMTGKWPVCDIDHKNLNKSDNRWVNLREATHAQNMHNQHISRANTSGLRGVSWHCGGGKWQAKIKMNGKQKYLGLFVEKTAAAAAYAKASAELHGEFGRAS